MPSTAVMPFLDVARELADKTLFTFENDRQEAVGVDGASLARRVETLGGRIQAVAAAQEKILLIFPQGLEYIYAVLACLHANVIAIPTPIPPAGGPLPAHLAQIVADAGVTCVLADSSLVAAVRACAALDGLTLLDAGQLLQEDVEPHPVRPRSDDDLAILLYTSGSISQPKGIRLSHGNLRSRAACSAAQWRLTRESRVVSWMPQFHSFGLELNFMIPLSQGAASVILSPGAFVKAPDAWWRAVQRHRATHTGAPNFAFDACAAVSPDALQGIDLSSVQAVMCGGEPVSKDTFERFMAKFSGLGLAPHALCAHYGLSEAGSVVTQQPGQPGRVLALDSAALQQGRVEPAAASAPARHVTSCGALWPDIAVRIIDPAALAPCKPGQVGEIWINSASVGHGYLNRPEDTLFTFGAASADGETHGYLRSGDLGFVEDEHLYIVGREKEVIIINGKNHFPGDIEWTIKKHVLELTLATAAFARVLDGQDRVVVVQELEQELDAARYRKLARKIVAAVSEVHGVEVSELSFVQRGLIAKTGSGKLQRSVCKRAYLNDEIAVLHRHQAAAARSRPAAAATAAPAARRAPAVPTPARIADTLKRQIFAPALDVTVEELDDVDVLGELGLDSIRYVQLAKRIEETFKVPFEPSLFFKYRDFAEVADYVHTQLQAGQAPAGGVSVPAPAAAASAAPSVSSAAPVASLARASASNVGADDDDIAIIGVSCHFPGGAVDLDSFWDNLVQGKDCVTPIPQDRAEFFQGPSAAQEYPRWGGFIGDVDTFDAAFFGISPLEAESMDPQQRKMLELTWHLFESAGYNPRQMAGQDVAVFVGAHNNDYMDLVRSREGVADTYGAFLESGLHMSMIANRVSRWFDFHGASEVINTACSSSLVAVHHAVDALRRGESRLAMAAGINLILSPRVYVGSHKAAMLSVDGRCKTFDQAANGFVRAEGYGAVLLKPRRLAERDGDTIHAIIKGAYVNHDGKSNSLRAPNLNAQRRLIAHAYSRVGVPLSSIGYIEAHGTGTSLGDPIEVQALKEGFAQVDPGLPAASCGLGTLKTHIGHAESAAGIGGIIKVLLQMRHATLPGVLHYRQLNPYISLQDSPFHIVERQQPWQRVAGPDGIESPLRAGVSSFGFGGVNAHVVLEAYEPLAIAGAASTAQAPVPALIVLSAQEPERLLAQAAQLAAALRGGALRSAALADLAYTLQVGRAEMGERLALVVESLTELEEKLSAFAAGATVDGVYRGQTRRDRASVQMFSADEDMAAVIDAWFARGKYGKLLECWVKGLALDWNKLYGDEKPRRIPLPVYPFAKDRHWLPAPDAASTGGAALHPLLQRNTSDLTGPRFSSTFNGAEFFLADHRIQGESLLPGAACLEMARAALVQLSGETADGSAVRVSHVAWPTPLKVTAAGVQAHISLRPEEGGALAYTIHSGPGSEPLVHSQGRVALIAPQTVRLDLAALQAQCPQQVSGEECYAAFRAIGLEYGPAHRAIAALQVGTGHVLARLSLPAGVAENNRFVLHPGMLDSALQASMGWMLQDTDGSGLPLALPFALQQLDVYHAGAATMWAVVTRGRHNERMQSFDIDLCGDDGLVCARLTGFTTRVVAGADTATGTLLLQPAWRAGAVAASLSAPGATPTYARRVAILCDIDEVAPEQIDNEAAGLRCLRWEAPQGDIAEVFGSFAERALAQVRELLVARAPGRTLVQIVVPALGRQQMLAALAGLLKTASLENPQLAGQLIRIDAGTGAEQLAQILQAELASGAAEVRYQDGERWVGGWEELAPSTQAAPAPWQERGVYLITGGAGGLGLIFADDIARQAAGATLILTGRSPLGEQRQRQLRDLEALGARVEYLQVDVADREAVAALMARIRAEHGRLDGIVHSAGVTRDSFILKKTAQELREVLESKVSGVVNLDESSRDFKLDCFICFSSVAAQGHVGQADYAMANAFMDAYSAYRNVLVASEQRHGRTLSVNWPLWQEGGMSMDAASERRMREASGMMPLATDAGIRALYCGLASGQDQVRVLEGELARLRAASLDTPAAQDTAPLLALPVTQPQPQPQSLPLSAAASTAIAQTEPVAHGTAPSAALAGRAVAYFKQLLSTVLRLPAHKIDADAPMEQYGIDSILVMQLTAELEKVFGSLSKTLFFEYQSIALLAEYFIDAYGPQLAALLGDGPARNAVPAISAASSATLSTAPAAPIAPIASSVPAGRALSGYAPAVQAAQVAPPAAQGIGVMEVAIIGVSGRYAQADNLSQFWDNLREGRDCISEIPAERWDHSAYFDPDRAPGKAYSKWGGFIDGIDRFDPLFFNISPREAETMDPQERLFLEQAYATIEDAGYTPAGLSASRKVGVFVGVMNGRYPSGARFWSIANRVSYLLNLQGPSLALDTACSSSLVAIHQALESLYTGSSECALAGGVNLIVDPSHYLDLSAMNMLSAGAQCRPFGQHADGFVDGEGVGAVLLKPLQQAIADGDHIYGVIKGSMVNAGGKTNGYTVPNPAAQAQLVGDALRRAGVDARSVSYLEAHGTGTALGDPIEIAGLDRAFRAHTADRQFCAIGSAKANIGHCESAAGIAGLTKVLLQMKHGQLAPSLHARQLNPHIRFADTAFAVQQDLAEWKRPLIETDGAQREYPRIAGVSSFGAGGVNAHVVVEEYRGAPRTTLEVTAQRPALIVLSARTAERLQEQVKSLLAALRGGELTQDGLASIAYTLQVGREAMEERLALPVTSLAELEHKLESFLAGREDDVQLYRGQVKRNRETLRVLAQDEDMAGVVEAWIAKGKYPQLLELWVKGMPLDWAKLYDAGTPSRVSLPTYPFARERYWQDAAPAATQPLAEQAPAPAREPISLDAAPTMAQALAALVANLTKIDASKIDGNTDFYEYGFDSISLAQLVAEINRSFALQLTPLVLFEHATVNRLASYLEKQVATRTHAGLRKMVVPGASPIPVVLYYPSTTPARRIEMGTFSLTVALDGNLPPSVKGLILISHCAGGSELGHHNLAQRLARDGYLVAALQHPGDNFHDRSLAATPGFLAERAAQLSRVLDALLADADWGHRIPEGKIGALGHSAGSGSVLALAGGVLAPRRLAQHCATAGESDAVFCEAFGAAGLAADDAPEVDARDSRIHAAVLLAPLGVVFAPDSLSTVALPLKIYAAQDDAVLADAYHADWLHAQLPQAAFEKVTGARHFSFMAQANRAVATDLGEWADPDGFERGAFHARLENEISAFFDAQLAPASPAARTGEAILFAGQGSQFKGMGKDLFPLYPELTRRASDILGYPVDELCLDDPQNRLGLTQYTQPALYVVNALGYMKLLAERGADYRPDYVAGHSLGEYNALLAAGVFDFETGLRLVQKRGELMGAAHGGGMRAVLGASRERVEALLREPALAGIDIANFNTPTQFILAGLEPELQALEARCAQDGVRCVPLKVSAAFHSRHMRRVQQEFAAFIADVSLQPPRIEVLANLNARPYDGAALAETLAAQIAHPVRWADSMRYLLEQGVAQFTEVGASVLSRMMTEIRNAQQAGAFEIVQ
ncbi:MAG: ACP S-malonyltransferase [Pseudomonadota bacterium]